MKLNYPVVIITGILTIVIMFWLCGVLHAEINNGLAVRAIIGEASNQGYQGMLALSVGLRNRGTLQGVYGLNAKHIDKEPQWVWEQAKRAWAESKYNRLHNGTFWGSTICDKAWIRIMEQQGYVLVYEYKDHKFYRVR